MKLSRYAKLGILVIFSLSVLIWGLNYLKGIDFFKRNTTYYVVYDKIEGLLESSAVMLNGYQVGLVSDISFLDDHSGKLLVMFSLEGDFNIPKGTVARIISSDLMGTKSVKLEIKQSNEFYAENDTLPGAVETDLKEQVSMQVLPLKKRAEELLASLDSAITVVTYVFNENTRQNLSESFEHINQSIFNIEKTSETLKRLIESNSGNISSIIENLDSISTTFKNNAGNFDLIVNNLGSISDTLANIEINPVLDQMTKALSGLNTVLASLQQTDNTAGLLLNDPNLYENLNGLTNSLDLLLKDFRNNPKRYVHFSAFDLGKEVYITSKPKDQEISDNIVFKVHLISSPSKVPTNNRLFEDLGEIEELFVSEAYNYMAGRFTNFGDAQELQNKARINFPDATIVAFKKGRKIKLERAIKIQK